MNDLPSFVKKLLENCPVAGTGVNTWLYLVARQLHAHLDGQQIFALLKEKTLGCGRLVKDSEIAHQIRSSRRTAWCPKNPHLFKHAETLTNNVNLPPQCPSWPQPNLDEIARIVSHGPGLADLYDASPVRLCDEETVAAEEVADVVWPGDPLLCCGKNSYTFATKRREAWRGDLSKCAYIVPNPMLKVSGRTQEGKQSQHTLEATGARVYLVIEFDFAEFAPDGITKTRLTPLVRQWKARGVTIADACGALHLHLSATRPLVLVTHSGAKSLHGWYPAFNRSEKENLAFMRYAVSLGADYHTWLRSQFVRMPGGTRDNGKHQSVHYLDSGKAVRA
jgi:hypothetical protein